MTCVEAAVAFIDRLEVSPELKDEASAAYKAYYDQLSRAGLKRNVSKVKMASRVSEESLGHSSEKSVLNTSNGNLSGMVDEDGVLRVSAGYAHQVCRTLSSISSLLSTNLISLCLCAVSRMSRKLKRWQWKNLENG